jgi:radical SAM superfamily enzyme with C-terminal helix-hairpin-helix motif
MPMPSYSAIKTAEQLLQRVFTEGRIAAQLRLEACDALISFDRQLAPTAQKLNLQPKVKIP